jgi:hypothetical protein
MKVLLGMLIAYVVIGISQLIVYNIASDSEAPMYITCFWMLPFIDFINRWIRNRKYM